MHNAHDLTVGHIPSLIRKLAIPASIGFFFHTMFNVVDTYYGGLVSTEALAALSLSFPIFFIVIALSSGIGTGATALISNALGEKNKIEAREYAGQAISFGIIAGIILTVIGLLISPSLFRLMGASGTYLTTALEYMNVIFYGAIFFIINQMLNSSLSAIGDTKSFRNFLVIGFFLNVILDPWFLWGGYGLPAIGFAGIAWATILIQFMGTVYLTLRCIHENIIGNDWRQRLKPNLSYYKKIASQGFPASLNMMTIAIGIFVITYFVGWFGKQAVAAYGIGTRIEQIALLPMIGLNMATLAIAGQNNGAKMHERVVETWKTALRYGIMVVAFGFVVVFFAAPFLMRLFSNDTEVIEIGTTYLHIASFISIAYVLMFITIAALQAMKKPLFAIFIGAYRQIIAPVIIFYLLALVLGLGLSGIWWGIFIVNWSAAVITLLYGKKIMNL
ncbi:MAG TPA: MATE family efflux transporter [Candidatus Nanoarchaeia archaeon]|nr:MATE family efflux transporter [Candidatus Nanoarchaeia archaeon]